MLKPRRVWLVWALRILLTMTTVVVGLFIWGHFQPKPPGFAPTDPDEGAFVTEQWTRYTIDVSSREQWAFFDFGRGRSVETTLLSDNWDLAFKRTDLLTNSGATNPSGLGGAIDLGEVPLELAEAPSLVTFNIDELGGEDGDELINSGISDWYDYNFITHTIHAEKNTYLVRSGEKLDVLVQFDSYYCENEDPGCVTFRYRLIPAVSSS